jgi:hypothetical protein
MSSHATVAPRAAGHLTPRTRAPKRGFVVAVLAALLAAGGLAAAPTPTAAASIKVAIIVGPAGANTQMYKKQARSYAAQARSYGANVVEVYTPNATWARAKSAANGANLLIYLGHGNGYPNPYHDTLDKEKVDGLGLNPVAWNGNTRTRYYGEYHVAKSIKLAPNAVVILNHLCYAAGSSEPGRANPKLSTAKRRADNFSAGFIASGAKAVFAETLGNASYIIRQLFATDRTMFQIFWAAPSKTGAYQLQFDSVRTSGMTVVMDPRKPGQYYRAVTGRLAMTAATWRP